MPLEIVAVTTMEVEISNPADALVSLDALREVVLEVVPWVLTCPGPGSNHLRSLSHLDIALVDDGRIARIHGVFLNDPTPTDVITFEYGEIVASAETARRMAGELHLPFEEELVRYVIHGLLHLAGHDDHDLDEARIMHGIQEEIVRETQLSAVAL